MGFRRGFIPYRDFWDWNLRASDQETCDYLSYFAMPPGTKRVSVDDEERCGFAVTVEHPTFPAPTPEEAIEEWWGAAW